MQSCRRSGHACDAVARAIVAVVRDKARTGCPVADSGREIPGDGGQAAVPEVVVLGEPDWIAKRRRGMTVRVFDQKTGFETLQTG